MLKGRPHSTRTTRSSRATGETASRYRHLEFERSYDEGRGALVNWYDSLAFQFWCLAISNSEKVLNTNVFCRARPIYMVRYVGYDCRDVRDKDNYKQLEKQW